MRPSWTHPGGRQTPSPHLKSGPREAQSRLSSQSTSQTEGWVSSPHELELGAAQIAFGFRAPQLAAGSHVTVHTPQIQLSPSSQSFALQSPRKCVSLLDDPPEEAPPQAATRSPAHRAQMLTVFIWYSIFLVRDRKST